MKTTTQFTLTALVAASLALPAFAQQTVNTPSGKLEFTNGYPSKATVKKLYDEMDYQRACQLYLWALPAVGVAGWQNANAFYGGGGDLDLVTYREFEAISGILTPNTTVTYMTGFPNLSKTGPVVLEIPAGSVVGIVMDYWQRPIADVGLTGPDKGKGVKLLILGPGEKAPTDTAGYRVIEVPTAGAFIGIRFLGPVDESKAVSEKSRLYPWSQRDNPPPQKHVWAAGKTFIQSAPRGLAYWEGVNKIIQREPVAERDRFFMAMLKPLGIEKGKPFKPDARQKIILTDGATVGEAMAKANSFDKRFPGLRYRPDAHWDYALVVDPNQRTEYYDQLDERAAWFYEAIGASYAMITTTPGVGSVYLDTTRDKDGDRLDGSRNYRLHVPPKAPMKQFWAATIYDVDTRTLIQSQTKVAEIRSDTQGLVTNTDGSVDVYVGPNAPKGFENNWVKTVAGKGWFAYFRLYAPLESYFDKSWPLPDFEKVK